MRSSNKPTTVIGLRYLLPRDYWTFTYLPYSGHSSVNRPIALPHHSRKDLATEIGINLSARQDFPAPGLWASSLLNENVGCRSTKCRRRFFRLIGYWAAPPQQALSNDLADSAERDRETGTGKRVHVVTPTTPILSVRSDGDDTGRRELIVRYLCYSNRLVSGRTVSSSLAKRLDGKLGAIVSRVALRNSGAAASDKPPS
ncbi:hypothetical protein TGME49_202330 [Toxoplasma gondii ME49]|uniref:Uncharacterized protein n=1 Tax=Toxoplasma gondii (strain ATCC 50611 / Me49) TaxID=508771 RepID=S8GEH0_TOXGM|nr:hypothetical protein TGME49_202330 [Toxoplasma gondii ME49]EPT30235.1 hypothetical protein TGME49_202330 [Toxoplasma gondii ME49]|eukprot:XP_002367518.1 hypothetical protein TGME49_202330 [Toxoplasma gondii ME49]